MIFALCCLHLAYAFRDFFRAVDRPGSTNFVSSPISWKRRSGVVAAELETLTGRTGGDAGQACRSPGEKPRQHPAVLPVWLALLVCGAAGTIKRSSPRRMGYPIPPRRSPSQLVDRRRVLAAVPAALLAGGYGAEAQALPFFGGKESAGYPSGDAKGELISKPEVCQGRCRDQDFVVVRYVGRRSKDGKPFDERYAEKPLTFELGSFYLPGVDAQLEGCCVGSKLRIKWDRSPSLGPDFDALLPPGTPIEMDLEFVTINYSLFGEKMRDSTNSFWFNQAPLTLTSALDNRGHKSDRRVIIKKSNPFSISASEKSFISNQTESGEMKALFESEDKAATTSMPELK